MPIEQISNALDCYVQLIDTDTAVTGATVTANVYRNGTLILSAQAATEIGGGVYRYTIPANSVTVEGTYMVLFAASGGPSAPVVWQVGQAGVEKLDATISSRAMSASSVVVRSAVADDGDVTIRRGRDYSGDYALVWTLSTPPETTPSSVVLTCNALGLSLTATYVDGAISVELTAAETAALTVGVYAFEIEATISGLSITLVDGTLTVERDV